MVRIVPKCLADFGLWLSRAYYGQLLRSLYYSTTKAPAWFDHRIDLYYLWPDNLFWLERGVFPRKHMFPGCIVLDLFCGDGFFSKYFYSTAAERVDALDIDPAAISHARRWHAGANINYHHRDAVTQGFPSARYDIILWFEGIEHLAEPDYARLVTRMKDALGATGILVGSTPIVQVQGVSNWQHQHEFLSTEDLASFLIRDFEQVQIEETLYPVRGGGQRRTAYFTLKGPR